MSPASEIWKANLHWFKSYHKCLNFQVWVSEWVNGCLTSQLTIFQSYMWRHIDVQGYVGIKVMVKVTRSKILVWTEWQHYKECTCEIWNPTSNGSKVMDKAKVFVTDPQRNETWSAIRMNTILLRYGYSVRTKQYTKSPNAKHAVKPEISMKTISFSDSAKRSAFSAG